MSDSSVVADDLMVDEGVNDFIFYQSSQSPQPPRDERSIFVGSYISGQVIAKIVAANVMRLLKRCPGDWSGDWSERWNKCSIIKQRARGHYK